MKKSFFITAALVLILTFINTLPGAAEDKKTANKTGKKTIAIFDFSANNVSPEYAKIVRNYLETSLYATKEFRMLERENIKKILMEKNISVTETGDTKKVVSAGKTLSADFIIAGTIDKLSGYKITVRVVNIEKGEILSVYTQDYESGEDVEPITGKIAKRISDDIKIYVKTGTLNSRFYDFYDVTLTARLNYILPSGELGSLVNNGIGCSLEAGVNHLFFNNTMLGLEIGYSAFSGSKNSNDKASFLPVLFNAGYKIDIYKKFYVAAAFSAGMNIVTLEHGTGDGFNIDENSSDTFLDPMVRGGIRLGIEPVSSVHFQLGANYGTVLEKDEKYPFTEINFGVVFVL